MRSRHGPTVVIGLGTRLMGDGAVGLELLDHLRDRYDIHGDVLTLDGEAWDRHLQPLVQSARRLVLLAAMDLGERPGTLIALEGRAVLEHFTEHPAPHWCQGCGSLDAADLVGRGEQDLVAIGIQPGPIALGLDLSPGARSGLDAAARLVSERLGLWGLPCEARLPAHA